MLAAGRTVCAAFTTLTAAATTALASATITAVFTRGTLRALFTHVLGCVLVIRWDGTVC